MPPYPTTSQKHSKMYGLGFSDDVFGNMTAALHNQGLYNDTLIVVVRRLSSIDVGSFDVRMTA